MKYLKLNNDLEVSQLVFGCMRISEMSVSELDELIQCCLLYTSRIMNESISI